MFGAEIRDQNEQGVYHMNSRHCERRRRVAIHCRHVRRIYILALVPFWEEGWVRGIFRMTQTKKVLPK
jgi:hypothetical protein